jgi:site-specific recombinase XerD
MSRSRGGGSGQTTNSSSSSVTLNRGISLKLRHTFRRTEFLGCGRKRAAVHLSFRFKKSRVVFARLYSITLSTWVSLPRTLQTYLTKHWKQNLAGFLFPNRKGTHPRWRDNVVKYGLKPVLRKLSIPAKDVGLHAFRHGLATELADAAVTIPVLQG